MTRPSVPPTPVQAPISASADDRASRVTIRPLATLHEYEECLAIQREIWGSDFRELVPPALLMVAQRLGGVCAGALDPDGRLLGFVFGLTGLREGTLAHWSHMLAVRPEARGAHLGERLKHHQRDFVRLLGVKTMYWTFDPLVARNAYLNLGRLGARVVDYVPDMYGSSTGSPLHDGLATDRVIVAWDLAERRRRLPAPPPLGAGLLVNPPGADGQPAGGDYPDAPRIRIAVPHDDSGEPLERRRAWRGTTRDAFLNYLHRGYTVMDFRRGDAGDPPSYELSSPASFDGSRSADDAA